MKAGSASRPWRPRSPSHRRRTAQNPRGGFYCGMLTLARSRLPDRQGCVNDARAPPVQGPGPLVTVVMAMAREHFDRGHFHRVGGRRLAAQSQFFAAMLRFPFVTLTGHCISDYGIAARRPRATDLDRLPAIQARNIRRAGHCAGSGIAVQRITGLRIGKLAVSRRSRDSVFRLFA